MGGPRISSGGPTRAAPGDAEVAFALEGFVRRAMNLQDGAITVEYHAGVATLTGSAGSASRARAIEDLVRWHDGVDSVINRLSAGILPAAPGTAR